MKNKEATNTLTWVVGSTPTLLAPGWAFGTASTSRVKCHGYSMLSWDTCVDSLAARKPVEALRELTGGYPHRPGQQPWLRSQITTSPTRHVSEWVFTWFQSPSFWVFLTIVPGIMEQRWVIHCVVSSLNSLPPNPWANLLCSRGMVALCH